MAMSRGTVLAVAAIGLYIIGGVSTFAGLGLLWLVRGKYVLGLGSGTSIGLLCVCVGLCLSILGVLGMRVLRNRRFR